MKSPISRTVLTSLTLATLASTAGGQISNSIFTWTDNAGNNNWVASSNWSQNPGSGDYPGEKESNEFVILDGSKWGSGGTGHFDLDLTTSSSPTTFEIISLEITTDGSSDHWEIQNGPQTGTISLSGELISRLNGDGNATIYGNLLIDDDALTWTTSGNKLVLAGDLQGDSSARLFGFGSNGGGLTLLSATTYAGSVSVNNNTLDLDHVNALQHGSVTLTNAGTLEYLDGTNLGKLGGTGSLALTNTLNVGTNNQNSEFKVTLSGAGTFRKKGTGTYDFHQENSHTGQTIIDNGSIKIFKAYALQNSPVWLNVDDGLDLNNLNATIGGLGGTGNLDLGNTTLTISGSDPIAHVGSISGNGEIIINRSATQHFFPSHTYSGGTTLLGGTLEIYGQASLGANAGILNMGSATLAVALGHTQNRAFDFAQPGSSATLQIANGETLTWSGPINTPAANQVIRKTGDGTLALTNNANTYPDTLRVEEGELVLTGSAMALAAIDLQRDLAVTFLDQSTTIGSLSGSGDLHLPGNQDLTFGGDDRNTTYNGHLTSNGIQNDCTKTGSGTFTLGGTFTLDGLTSLNEGALQLNGDLSSAVITRLSSAPGTFLRGTGISSGHLNLSGTIAPGSNTPGDTGTLRASSLTLGGTYECDINGVNTDLLVSDNILDISSATLDLSSYNGSLSSAPYLIASYGSLAGPFAAVIGLPAGYDLDYSYHNGISSNNIALIIDTAPEATAITATGNALGEFSVDFDQIVTGFNDFDDLVVTSTSGNASATGAAITGGPTNYLVQLTGLSGEGALTLAVATGGDVQDGNGNKLIQSVTSAPLEFDFFAPNVISITPSTTGPTNSATLEFDVVFDQPVVNFDHLSDLLITTTGTAAVGSATFSDQGTVYTLTLGNLTGDGTFTLAVGGDVEDSSGNPLASSPVSPAVAIDRVSPALLSITPQQHGPTNSPTLNYIFVFDEEPLGFDDFNDLVIETVNPTHTATASGAIISNSGAIFTVTLTGVSGDGELTISLAPGNNLQDDLGNLVTSALQSAPVTIDNTGPSVLSIVPSTTGPTGAPNLEFTVTFNEDVIGFDHFDDLLLETTNTANATDAIISGGDKTYTVTLTGVTGVGQLTLAVDLLGDVRDSTGNALVSSVISAPVHLTDFQVLAWLFEEGSGTFLNENVSGLSNVASLQGPSTWTAAVAPNSTFALALANDSPTPGYVDAGTLKSDDTYVAGSDPDYRILSNNWSVAAWVRLDSTQSQTSDRVIASSDWNSSDGWTFFVKDGAVEENLGFDFGSGRIQSNLSLPLDQDLFVAVLGDSSASFGPGHKHRFAVWNGLTWQYSDGTTFSNLRLQGLELGSFNNGQRQFEGALDEVRIYNRTLTQSELDGLVADTSPPSVTAITTTAISPTKSTSIDFEVTFKKPVVNFDHFSDLVLGGTAYASGATITGSGQNYTVTLTGIAGNGPLTLAVSTLSDIEDASGLDLASSATSTPIIIDNTAPTGSITALTSSPAHTTPLEFSIIFDEFITGLSESDFILTFSGTHGTPAISGSDDRYTFSIPQVSGDGILTLEFSGSGGALDLVGNPLTNNGSNAAITVDTVGPVATFARVTAHPTSGNEAVFNLNFDSIVSNLDLSDLEISYPGSFDPPVITGSSPSYTVTISNITGDAPLIVDLSPLNDIVDGDGNPVSAVTTASIHVDNIGPSVMITPTTLSPTNSSTVEFLVTFSEQVDQVQMDDFLINFPGTHSPPEPWTQFSKTLYKQTQEGYYNSLTTLCLRIPGVTGTGDLSVSMNPTTDIVDKRQNPFVSGTALATVTVDQTAPTLLSIVPETTGPTTNRNLSFLLTFDEAVIPQPFPGIFTVNHSGTSHTELQIVGGNIGSTITVQLTGLSGNGTLTLSVNDPGGITDRAGNALSTGLTSAAVIHVDPFDYNDWATHYGLTPDNNDPDSDPDNDGFTNKEEFAIDGNPLAGGSAGKIRLATVELNGQPIPGDGEYLTYTFPTRNGAVFINDPVEAFLRAGIDEIVYTIAATENLTTYHLPLFEHSEVLSAGLPPLSPGWSYRTFLLGTDLDATNSAFFRLGIDFQPTPGP